MKKMLVTKSYLKYITMRKHLKNGGHDKKLLASNLEND